MLLVEIYIEIENYDKAEYILETNLKSVKFNEKRSKCERTHWKAVILLKKGTNNSAITLLSENLAYAPS